MMPMPRIAKTTPARTDENCSSVVAGLPNRQRGLPTRAFRTSCASSPLDGPRPGPSCVRWVVNRPRRRGAVAGEVERRSPRRSRCGRALRRPRSGFGIRRALRGTEVDHEGFISLCKTKLSRERISGAPVSRRHARIHAPRPCMIVNHVFCDCR
jgi:hypothetical protein